MLKKMPLKWLLMKANVDSKINVIDGRPRVKKLISWMSSDFKFVMNEVSGEYSANCRRKGTVCVDF